MPREFHQSFDPFRRPQRRSEIERPDPRPVLDRLTEKLPTSPGEILPFVKTLREEVTVPDLLHDRHAQALIDAVMTEHAINKAPGSPFPPLRLPNRGETRSHRHFRKGTFMLDDNSHIYFFDSVAPVGLAYEAYLREEDVVLTEEHVGFTKPLERAPLHGGPIQRYNYHTASWETSEIDTNVNHTDPVLRHMIKDALGVLGKDDAKLYKRGQNIEDRAARAEKKRKDREAKKIAKRTVRIEIGGQEVSVITSEQQGVLSQYLQKFSEQSHAITIVPELFSEKGFTAHKKGTAPNGEGVVFEDVTASLPELTNEEDEVERPQAIYLGKYDSKGGPNVNFRLIAVPIDGLLHPPGQQSIPSDVVFAVGGRLKPEEPFRVPTGGFNINAALADIIVKDPDVVPEGLVDGRYAVFAHQTSRPEYVSPESVRVMGLSASAQTMFYQDVDVTQEPPSLIRRMSV